MEGTIPSCDWGPESHKRATHLTKYECPFCHTYKVIQLCDSCWNWATGYEELFCLSCPHPFKVSTTLLYTHMGTP